MGMDNTAVRREFSPRAGGSFERVYNMSKTIDFASASASLVSRLDRSASKFVKPTRDGIGACVRFILETGGIQDGRRKKGNEPAIPSTRQMLVNALNESGFCPASKSNSTAKNFADIALAIVRGDIAGIDIAGAGPVLAERTVRAELLPDATRAGEFVALVRGDDVKPKNAKKGKKAAKKADRSKSDAEYLADALAAIDLMTEVGEDAAAMIAEAVAAKMA
jgi:hypothetical protein